MGRRIITKQLQAASTGVGPTPSADVRPAAGAGAGVDGYFDRLVKYIPADVIAAWTAATGFISGATGIPTSLVLWIAFGFLLLVTALWTRRNTSVAGKPTAATQIVLSTIAFGVWVFALGGPFATLSWYNAVYGSLLLIAYTLIVPLITPPEG